MIHDATDGAPLYGVLTGLELPEGAFSIATGIDLRPNFSDIFSSPMLAYSPPKEKGKSHPGPWSALTGGTFLKCRVELAVGQDRVTDNLTPQTVAWLVAALLRLHIEAPIRLAAVAHLPFVKEHSDNFTRELFEAAPVQWGIFRPDSHFHSVTASNQAWIVRQFPRLLALWPNEQFQRAFEVFDQARWSASAEAAAGMLWTAIEILLGLSASRDKGRLISQSLSQFIAEAHNGARALVMIRDLYRKRGSIVHAGSSLMSQDFVQLFRVASVAFQRAIIHGLPDTTEA